MILEIVGSQICEFSCLWKRFVAFELEETFEILAILEKL